MLDGGAIFLTGGTGFLGAYTTKLLLEKGYKVFCLVRGKGGLSPRERMLKTLRFWDENLPDSMQQNLYVLEGDVSVRGLDFSEAVLHSLGDEVSHVFHFAAVTEINRPFENIRKINMEGVKNVLDFALKIYTKGNLKKVNHISTAYICGAYPGAFCENDFDVGQDFNTTYEQSKFEAEKLVYEYRKSLWIDIFRPAIVVGESATGKIDQFRNIYQFLQLCRLKLFREIPLQDTYVNLVSIDEMSKALLYITFSAKDLNKTYHLFPEVGMSLEEFSENVKKISGIPVPTFVKKQNYFDTYPAGAQQMLLKRITTALNHPAKLKSDITNAFLQKQGAEKITFRESIIENMLKYFLCCKK